MHIPAQIVQIKTTEMSTFIVEIHRFILFAFENKRVQFKELNVCTTVNC